MNSKRDKSLHLEKVGGWRRLCIYIYSQLGKRSGHLGVNLLTKGIKQNKYYGQRMEHGHQRWGSFWDFYCLHHLDSGHNHGNKRLFWKASKNTCFHIFSLGRTFDSSGFSTQVARWKAANAGLMNFISAEDLSTGWWPSIGGCESFWKVLRTGMTNCADFLPKIPSEHKYQITKFFLPNFVQVSVERTAVFLSFFFFKSNVHFGDHCSF